ncbi:MAG: glycosyltransferase [Lachnospiraceae bacterium]|nr:glycosyltransferase [Lachnospiraceae bacterium]
MELISVIIPAYNVDKYLTRCLDSVLDQSYGDLEIVIVDDGSSDDTPQICDEYSKRDSRIKVVHKANEGVAAARNTALDTAKGEMIAFCDADDYYEKDMIRQLHDALVRNSADLVVCGYYEDYSDRTDEYGGGDEQILTVDLAYEEFFKMGGRIGSGCWNKMFRAEVLKDIRYKHYVMGEDVELICRALDNCERTVLTGYKGYHYVHRENSATQTDFRPANMDIIKAVDEMVGFIRIHRPKLLPQLYGFRAAWYVATLQVIDRTSGFKKNKHWVRELRDDVKINLSGYIRNRFVAKRDKILLTCLCFNCFIPALRMYECLRKAQNG